MPDSFRLRVLQMILAELATVPGIGETGLDLKAYEHLPKSKFPAAYVVAGSGGVAEAQPPLQQRMELVFTIRGYVLGPGATSDGVTLAREVFYGQIENALLGTGLRARFDADFLATGQQVLPVELTASPSTDAGQSPPWGWFELPASAVLHYARGAL